MADTTNATYDGGIYVPHECLSGANIERISVSSKDFSNFNIKTKGSSLLKLHPFALCFVPSYYNNYVTL
jgi:hypothetical protein